jgi:hypothetical protein
MSTSPATQDRDPRAPEGAVFAPTVVRGGRGQRTLAGIVVVALGGLVVIGAVDHGAAPETNSVAAASEAAAPATPLPSSPTSSRPAAAGPLASPGSQHGRAVVDGLVQLDIRPAGSRLFVHGDVYSLKVTVVVLSIEDAAGHVADERSVHLQGGSTAFRLGANTRFDALFDVPDELMGEGLWVRADAYDTKGRILEAQQQPVVAPVVD